MSDSHSDYNFSSESKQNSLIEPVSITDEMQKSYLDYAMSVIVSRALPDVRDGLKPVHRRILHAMNEMHLYHNRSYRKSAAVIGEVMGKYHPHGDASIYDALVRMAQDFSMRDPLIDGQGNFGSVDGDPPAAMRYTECRLEELSQYLLEDIEKETVDFQENYDGREVEPKVLPARFPNLLVNGSGGIAVGMATNIPPHNLGEVIDATIALIENPNLTLAEVMEYIPGPDFPTGGIILGKAGIKSAYETGRGSILVRAKVDIEKIRNDREAIIVTQLPYQVNKASMIEKMAELVRDKKIEGISDLRDESDREGYRIVIELKRDAISEVVLNQLYRYTQLQTSFSANMVALNGGRPQQLNLLAILSSFVSFREDVVSRRTKFLLRKARERAHSLVGLVIAVNNIDEVIHLIRQAPDAATAKADLMSRDWDALAVAQLLHLIDDPLHKMQEDNTYRLSEEQAKSILELRLQRLTAMGVDEIGDELNKLGAQITEFLDILASRTRIMQIVRQELEELRAVFATPRRTVFGVGEGDMQEEDLIAKEDMVVTVSHAGYIKRVPVAAYRAQKRGGKGRSGMSTKDEDVVTRLFIASTHAPILFFSSRGIVYKEKVWRLPLGSPQARGKALINLLPLEPNERITSIMALPEDEAAWANLDIMFATTSGTVRRNKLSDFVQVNKNGKIAMKLEESGDSILAVETCTSDDDVVLTAASGMSIRFPVENVRVFSGRNSVGVRGIKLADGDRAISMSIIRHLEISAAERSAYLRRASSERSILNSTLEGAEAFNEAELDLNEVEDENDDRLDLVNGNCELSDERYEFLAQNEQLLLTISERGYGKLFSSYDFRISLRGGKGIRVTDFTKLDEIGRLVALFPVSDTDQIMLVSDGGQLIRVPVAGIRIARRATKGVKIFHTAQAEKVVSVDRISESELSGSDGEPDNEQEVLD